MIASVDKQALLDDARVIHEEIAELVRKENAGTARIGALLLEMKERRLFRAYDATSVADYAWKKFKRSARWTRELIELAENLKALPLIAEKYQSGALPWTLARDAARAAKNDGNEGHWLARSMELPRDELRREIAASQGEQPVHIVTLELTPEQHVKWEQAKKAVMLSKRGERLTTGALFEEICQSYLGGGRGRPRHRITVTVCDACGEPRFPGGIVLARARFERCACDADVVGLDGEIVKRAIPAHVRRIVEARDSGRCRVPGCSNHIYLETHHHFGWRSKGHDPEHMYLLCEEHHTSIHDGLLSVRSQGTTIQFFGAGGSAIGGPIELSIHRRRQLASSPLPSTSAAVLPGASPAPEAGNLEDP